MKLALVAGRAGSQPAWSKLLVHTAAGQRLRNRYWARECLKAGTRAVFGGEEVSLARKAFPGANVTLLTPNTEGSVRGLDEEGVEVVELCGSDRVVSCLDCGADFRERFVLDWLRAANEGWMEAEGGRKTLSRGAMDAFSGPFDIPGCRAGLRADEAVEGGKSAREAYLEGSLEVRPAPEVAQCTGRVLPSSCRGITDASKDKLVSTLKHSNAVLVCVSSLHSAPWLQPLILSHSPTTPVLLHDTFPDPLPAHIQHQHFKTTTWERITENKEQNQ